MTDEGLGYALAIDKLINVNGGRLCFKPLMPKLTVEMSLVWKKQRPLTRAAERFIEELKGEL